VDWPEDVVPEDLPAPEAAGKDRREVPEMVAGAAEAEAEAGSAHTTAHAMRISERLTTRG
jgi:hypothetical protein